MGERRVGSGDAARMYYDLSVQPTYRKTEVKLPGKGLA